MLTFRVSRAPRSQRCPCHGCPSSPYGRKACGSQCGKVRAWYLGRQRENNVRPAHPDGWLKDDDIYAIFILGGGWGVVEYIC